MTRRLKFTLGAMAAVVLSTAALASEIAPEAVEFTDDGVVASLTGTPGDPAEGAKVFKNTGLGNCLACHVNADMESDQFHGDVGPPLDGVASRWDEPLLRAIVVNSKVVFTDETVMPGFYSLEVGKGVAENFVGKTILTAQQVEDVVAYLVTLKE
ncbi:MAG: sulfur oxidation c-type cytochrome SoxX [Hoeflea sp.]|uniref:sulfur oxidation c-type cytochrome SoxX n=1 Tax=Hoeflea sp. TaxID=1940281 RepID=UPI00272F5EE9|nr:sulfur oxidation c-type cytochrome SoxX [Hoeflea sp.]MDP2122493.1 sulfur oxidation c-type cytochrome SoxX [Hoeflea sp.]MDP3524193.1 sulfur oxidation c-type cytochrome SoxX [Hoeflea sp.]MDZ7602157.1 sulfur oxidation c-type cytochrome SoxX [Hoeflea sp.]